MELELDEKLLMEFDKLLKKVIEKEMIPPITISEYINRMIGSEIDELWSAIEEDKKDSKLKVKSFNTGKLV